MSVSTGRNTPTIDTLINNGTVIEELNYGPDERVFELEGERWFVDVTGTVLPLGEFEDAAADQVTE